MYSQVLFCLFAQIVLIRLFEECERNGVKTRASFFELERADNFVLAQVLEKCFDKIAHSSFDFFVSIFEPAFLKHVGKGDCRRHLLRVCFYFHNAMNDVVFDRDEHGRIVLIGHVEERGFK